MTYHGYLRVAKVKIVLWQACPNCKDTLFMCIQTVKTSWMNFTVIATSEIKKAIG